MASTVLPNGIIIPEKYSRDWYNDLYHNWQELDNLLGVSPNDGTLTIQKNGTTVGTFSANQETDETIDLSVPTKTSDLTNDSGFITGVSWDDVNNKPTFAAVATSGSYDDLSDKPSIPTVNNATLTIQRNGTTIDTFTANASVDKTINISTTDDTKIPLSGTNALAGSIVPNTDNAYDFGSSTYKLRYIYANTAYVTNLNINGSPAGDILTHNANEFVDVTSAQTISGLKTFGTGGCKFYKQIIINHDLLYSKNNPPSLSAYHNLMFTDASGWWGGYLENVTDTSGNSTLALYVRNTNEIQSRVYLRCDINGSFSMYPLSNNVWNLGTSTNKWKAINGVSPGALSLPGGYVNVDTTNWVLDGTVNVFTPTSDGWLGIQGIDTVYNQAHYVFIGRNDSSSYHTQNVLSPVSGQWINSYHGCAFIPVIKDVKYDIRCICSSIIVTFYPCQGNV